MEKYKYKRLKGNDSPRDNSFNSSWVARQFKGIREAVAGVDLETRRKEAVANGFYTITAHGFLFHTAALMDLFIRDPHETSYSNLGQALFAQRDNSIKKNKFG